MVRLEMKSCNKILTVKYQKYLHYHQVKFLQENKQEKQTRIIEDPAKNTQKQLKI